jgi:2'-5' RNA ligase
MGVFGRLLRLGGNVLDMDADWDAGYQRLWGMRVQPPVVTEGWADSDWAKGRTDYLTFLIRVEAPGIMAVAQKVQEGLGAFSCADPFPPEYLHLTVKETGCFIVGEKDGDDEITREGIDQLVVSATKALEGMQGFKVNIRNINNFRSNIVAEAHDGGEIREMNRRLMGLDGVKAMNYDYPRFLPHMSLCQFKGLDDYTGLIGYIEENRETSFGGFMVKNVELVKAILPVKGRYPTLETIHMFRIG